MSNLFNTLIVTLIVGVGTYFIRAGSLSLGGRVVWPSWIREWLLFVTPAVLGALLGPEIFLQNNHLVALSNNKTLLAAIPTGIVAWYSRKLLLTVAIGVACFAAISYFI